MTGLLEAAACPDSDTQRTHSLPVCTEIASGGSSPGRLPHAPGDRRAAGGQREVFDLVWIDGMTQAKAAQVIGVSAVTVKRWLSRGLRLVTERLADSRPGEEPPDAIQVHTGRE